MWAPLWAPSGMCVQGRVNPGESRATPTSGGTYKRDTRKLENRSQSLAPEAAFQVSAKAAPSSQEQPLEHLPPSTRLTGRILGPCPPQAWQRASAGASLGWWEAASVA